jgi:RimJ/RimL family protein N-acetyltransferase
MPALPFPNPPLGDAIVALRPWRASDMPRKVAAFSDPLCQHFSWPGVEPYTEADALASFEYRKRARLRGEELGLAVVDPTDADRVWGGASLYDVNRDEARAAVGLWLAPEARGRGIATQALRLLAGWAFEQLGVARLEATCAPENIGSQRMVDRCGFVREGLLRSHSRFKGGRQDLLLFSLLPGELR